MKVTKDKYQLPLMVADSLEELSERDGNKINNIRSIISKWKHGRLKNPSYVMVEVDDE